MAEEYHSFVNLVRGWVTDDILPDPRYGYNLPNLKKSDVATLSQADKDKYFLLAQELLVDDKYGKGDDVEVRFFVMF